MELAKRRALRLNGGEVYRTPVLVPSFSSKVPYIDKIIKTTEEVIDGPILVSAYDIYYREIQPPFDFAPLIFLDSGGYEASKDMELSDIGDGKYAPKEWTIKMHEKVLSQWKPSVPSVVVSYDHPKERLPIGKQIERARAMMPGRTDVMREILLKPEPPAQQFLDVEKVLLYAHELAAFDLIGVTEWEIGNSILERMERIARLRIGLERIGLEIPIHVFGSLDTMTTPMYFLAGADIFDGLTWLRYAYFQGYTMYKHNFGILDLGIKAKRHIIDGRTWYSNYRYLVELQLELQRYLKDRLFSSFTHHGEIFEKALKNTLEAIGE